MQSRFETATHTNGGRHSSAALHRSSSKRCWTLSERGVEARALASWRSRSIREPPGSLVDVACRGRDRGPRRSLCDFAGVSTQRRSPSASLPGSALAIPHRKEIPTTPCRREAALITRILPQRVLPPSQDLRSTPLKAVSALRTHPVLASGTSHAPRRRAGEPDTSSVRPRQGGGSSSSADRSRRLRRRLENDQSPPSLLGTEEQRCGRASGDTAGDRGDQIAEH